MSVPAEPAFFADDVQFLLMIAEREERIAGANGEASLWEARAARDIASRISAALLADASQVTVSLSGDAAIVDALAACNPLYVWEGVCVLCRLCDGAEMEEHAHACPWRRAREARGLAVPPVGVPA